ncbi:MAG: GMP reductase [Deltaproteobacteria bacterium]|nr:GMP reductase [Deltaproteobacteria bacterium]
MRIENDIKLDYKDVIIKPKRSEAPSRKKITLERTYRFLNSKTSWTGVPIIAANMDTTGTMKMGTELAKHRMMTCLHKHYPADKLINYFDKNQNASCDNVFFTLGIKDIDFEKLIQVAHSVDEIRNICVDVANGYTEFFVDRVKRIREKFKDSVIMAGNICTPEMVSELLLSGAADIIKIGIGPGSVCTTRIIAGVGYPQLSAIIECADAAHGLKGHVCADGGCTQPGDIAKAFGAGADFVMLGNMFAGHEECEGEWQYMVSKNDLDWTVLDKTCTREELTNQGWPHIKKHSLVFYGMSSKKAIDKYSGGLNCYRAAEGKITKVPYKGGVSDEEGVVQKITGGLKSTCAYVGASSLKDLPKCTTFVRCYRTHNDIFGS